MLVTYNFYNSMLLQRLINQFVRAGKKHKVEIVITDFFMEFSRVNLFSALWIILSVVELHKPALAFRVIKRKNKIVYKPKMSVALSSLLGVGLRWIKEGVHGDLSHIKKKRYIKFLRRQSRVLQKRVKQQGLLLTDAEQLIIDKEKSRDLLRRKQTRPFSPAFREYFLSSCKDFKESYGFKQLHEYNSKALESYMYHSYKW